MVDVTCPVDSGCDYSGPVRSVEAHISGSQQGDHQGEVGRDHREELVDRAEATASGGATEDQEVAESPDDTGEDYPSEATSVGGSPVAAAPALFAPLLGTAATGGSSGWDRSTMVTVGAVIVLLGLLYLAGGDGADSSGTSTAPESDESDGETPGGLIA